ncbi:hypothetical protein C0J52_24325 [Blattella germanica]|nr:hypothetical protein C0J52_24325 [Blattella germanica]
MRDEGNLICGGQPRRSLYSFEFLNEYERRRKFDGTDESKEHQIAHLIYIKKHKMEHDIGLEKGYDFL